jgi:hypothetical protein
MNTFGRSENMKTWKRTPSVLQVDLPVYWDIWFNMFDDMGCSLKSIDEALWEIVHAMKESHEARD